MSKLMLSGFVLSLFLFLTLSQAGSGNSAINKKPDSRGQTGTLQKMIVENGMVRLDLDLDRLNADGSLAAKVVQLRFAVAAISFFSILVFNDLLRGPEQGSMALVPQYSTELPSRLTASINQLVVEKLPSSEKVDLAIRDAKTGFTFFNIEGHQYDYDANGQLLNIQNGRLLISEDFANALGRPSDVGSRVGKISISARMQPIEVTQLINGEPKSMVMPALHVHVPLPGTTPGPDVIVGDLPAVQQFGSAGTQVGVAVATTSCNAGTIDLDWFQLPNTDHPVIPQNLYRMSGGADNTERFEQIGQSWLKHAFTALTNNDCNYGCNGVGGSHLGSGCSDPYSSSLNYSQSGLGSRAWVNPFTGFYPRGDSTTPPANHSGHTHSGASHRVAVLMSDLNTTLNVGATYFAEGQYVTPHEYAWCQAHSGQCNMYNNVSYRQFTVTGTGSPFTFSPAASTQRAKPAIVAWTGATVGPFEPVPGTDG